MGPLQLEIPAPPSASLPRSSPSSGAVLRRTERQVATLEGVVGSGRRFSLLEQGEGRPERRHERFYDLRDSGCRVGIVREIATPLRRSFFRRLWRAHGSLEAEVLDGRGARVLLRLQRDRWILASKLELTDPNRGGPLGVVRRRFHPWRRRYTLEDSGGEVFATVSSPLWRPWAFPVVDSDGALRATIRKRWHGFSSDTARRGATAEVDFGEHGWTLEQRCVLLALAIAIDLDSVESDAG